ncbi:hypothetical protein [Streptomyces halstedii]|uniref:Uncharacterized protein n=1 Tax=Streptomyces halstedii TaxID=1944 RepID=A0A6N9U3M5_STRHA|nr:hypothetical protein [Streptomyces halstedii]NEA18410.1 hypothetical protein [Streptomyces halstedii]
MHIPHFVTRQTTKDVARRTTKTVRPEAESNRLYAWQHLTTRQAPVGWTGEMANIPSLLPPTGTLGEIADKYDEAARLIEIDAADDLSETDLLASLLVIRALREKLLEDESRLISTARRKKVTWARLADALELGSRQAAERRHLQLRTDIDELVGTTLTQQDRVEYARDQRDRRAERTWATSNATKIRTLALCLLRVPDLQARADRSLSAQRAHETAVRSAEQAGLPLPEKPTLTTWPGRLREAFEADASLQAVPGEREASLSPARLKATRVANAVHQLSGLLATAASPDNIDLADQGTLGPDIAALYTEEGAPALP